MKAMLLLLFLALPLAANAEIYSWTDAAGTVHFTEDLGSVPKKYRKKLTSKKSDETSADQSSSSRKSVTSPRTGAVSSASPVASPPGTEAALQGQDNVYGGRKGADWQLEFRQKRTAMQEVDRKIKQLHEEMKSPRKILTAEKMTELNSRRAELIKQYEAAATQLNQLVEQANKAGLPKEFTE